MTTPDDTRPEPYDRFAKIVSNTRYSHVGGGNIADQLLAALRDSGWVDPEEAAKRQEVTDQYMELARRRADAASGVARKAEAERDALLPVVEAAKPVAEVIRPNLAALFGTAVAVGERFVAAVDALESREESTDGR